MFFGQEDSSRGYVSVSISARANVPDAVFQKPYEYLSLIQVFIGVENLGLLL